MAPSDPEETKPSETKRKLDWRLIPAALLLAVAGTCTWWTIQGLSARRRAMRIELAEISHARYDLLNVDHWIVKIMPILDAQIDALDLKAAAKQNLRPMVQSALYRLLDVVKEKMSAPPDPKAKPTGLPAGNPMLAGIMINALKPQVPQYTDVVLAELGKSENAGAIKKYMKSVLADGAKTTFGKVDMRYYNYILKEHGCADAGACQQLMGRQIQDMEERINVYYLTALGASAAMFLLLMIGWPMLGRGAVVVLALDCLVLLAGGILTPMLEVEAKITHLGLTFMGTPIAFDDQVLYFQSKSVLEVFHVLVTMGRPDMWIVGMLVLMFSVVFPVLKILSLSVALFRPALLRTNRVVKFFALESSKWSMADVMALAIFMSFVAFNGLIANSMNGLKDTGAQVVIPTDSSKILPGYLLFIGFCLASLFLARKLGKGIRTAAEG